MSLDLPQLYRDFDHNQRATNVDLYVERHRAPARAIFQALALEPGKHFIFCGSIGSGKSSELAYLGHLLDSSTDPAYQVIGLDVYQSIAKVETIRPAELLMLIGAAIVRAHQDWHGKPVDRKLIAALREAFFNVGESKVDPGLILEGVALLTWGIATKDLPTAGKGVGNVARGMGNVFKGKRRAPIGGLTRESARDGDPDIMALLEVVNDLLDFVREQDGRTPVILVDGLDKISRVSDIDTVRKLFCEPLLSGINASVTYTVPITMMLDTEWNSASRYFERARLSNVVVAPPSNGDCEPELVAEGRALLREVVTKRLAQHELTEQDVFEDGALDELVGASGGELRCLIHLVRRAIQTSHSRSGARVTLADARHAMHEHGHEFEISMNSERRKELRAIVDGGEPSGSPIALDLMLMNWVLHYRNGHTWWAPTPLVGRLLTPAS